MKPTSVPIHEIPSTTAPNWLLSDPGSLFSHPGSLFSHHTSVLPIEAVATGPRRSLPSNQKRKWQIEITSCLRFTVLDSLSAIFGAFIWVLISAINYVEHLIVNVQHYLSYYS